MPVCSSWTRLQSHRCLWKCVALLIEPQVWFSGLGPCRLGAWIGILGWIADLGSRLSDSDQENVHGHWALGWSHHESHVFIQHCPCILFFHLVLYTVSQGLNLQVCCSVPQLRGDRRPYLVYLPRHSRATTLPLILSWSVFTVFSSTLELVLGSLQLNSGSRCRPSLKMFPSHQAETGSFSLVVLLPKPRAIQSNPALCVQFLESLKINTMCGLKKCMQFIKGVTHLSFEPWAMWGILQNDESSKFFQLSGNSQAARVLAISSFLKWSPWGGFRVVSC